MLYVLKLSNKATFNLNLKNKRPLIADFIAYCDGKKDVIDIAEILGIKAY